MAKGKKSKRSGVVSQGIVGTTKTRDKKSPTYAAEHMINQLAAYKKGKRVMLTIENPDKSETNRRFIRVPATDVWGSRKKA